MRDTVVLIVGAVVAVILQVIVSPNIALMYAMPNFIMVFVCAVAMTRTNNAIYVVAFVMGLLYDLMGNNPVGLMSALLVVAVFFVSRAFTMFDHEAFLVPLVMSVVVSLCVEVLYGLGLVFLGLDVSLIDAILFRALPCALYDAAAGLIVLPLIFHFIKPSDNRMGGFSTPSVLHFR